jgi:hypothetical protein
MSEVRNLIDAISTGDAVGTEESFGAAMAEKISAKLDDMRQAIAQTMFNHAAEADNIETETQE